MTPNVSTNAMGTMSTQIATSSAAIQEPLTLHQHEARKAKRVPPEDETPSLTASVSEDYSGLLDARALAANQQFLQSPPRKKMKHGGPNSSLYGLSLRPSRLSLRTLVTPQILSGGAAAVPGTDPRPAPLDVHLAAVNDIVRNHTSRLDLARCDKEASLTSRPACREVQQESLAVSPETQVDSTARLFAERVMEMQHGLLQSDDPDMNAINFRVTPLTDLQALAHTILEQQAAFLEQTLEKTSKAVTVDIGYIYTDRACTHRFRDPQALLTKATPLSGAHFGTGIYTADNPFAGHPDNFFSGETDSVGVLVARVRGDSNDVNSVIGRPNRADQVIVLKEASQCLPLAHYSASLVELDKDDGVGNDMVFEYHCRLQAVVDDVFNGGRFSAIPRIVAGNVVRSLPQLVPH